jgi:hypothetical protein
MAAFAEHPGEEPVLGDEAGQEGRPLKLVLAPV